MGYSSFSIEISGCTHSSAAIKSFVSDYIANGTTVVSDGLKSYDFLDKLDIKHERYVVSKSKSHSDSNLEHVHLVVSLVKRWMLGTLQGAVTPAHIAEYLDEYAFRFNRRTSTHRGKLFHRLIQQAATTRPKNIKDFYNHREAK